MKLLRSILFALCLAGVAGPAIGQDAGEIDSGIPSTYLQGLSGRYVGGASGNSATYGIGTGVSAAAGSALSSADAWHPMESFRMELEYAYRDRDSALLTGRSATGAIGSLGTMANARFNMKVADWLTPYVGVGLGWTGTEAERNAASFTGARAESFAYEGVVGLSVPFSDGLSFFADGRYLRGGESHFAASEDFATHGSAQTWTALAGVRFTFGK